MNIRLKPLDEQVIVILGASSGIGLATARLAAGRGARLVLASRSPHALDRLAAELDGTGRRVVTVTADVSHEDDVRRVADAALRHFGGFDTWINNAAVSAYGTCLDVSLADMRRIIDTNLFGVVHGSRIACAHLRRTGGALINIGSIVSDRAVPLQGMYSASKHAIKAWTDALRAELQYERAPVSVTLIKPSAIDTPYAEHARNYLPDQPTHSPPVYTPRAVARAILYAAEHPVRDIVVGSAGKLLGALSAVSPGLTDLLMARVLLPATHSGRPPRGRPILDQPGEDLRERGDYRGIARPSLYTALRRHRAIGSVTGIAGAVVLGRIWTSAAAGELPDAPGIGEFLRSIGVEPGGRA